MDSPARSSEQATSEGRLTSEDQGNNNTSPIHDPTSINPVMNGATRPENRTVAVFTWFEIDDSGNEDSDTSSVGAKDTAARHDVTNLHDDVTALTLGDDVIALHNRNEPEHHLAAVLGNQHTLNNDVAGHLPLFSDSTNLTDHNTQTEAVAGQETHTETADLASDLVNLTDYNTRNEAVAAQESHTRSTDLTNFTEHNTQNAVDPGQESQTETSDLVNPFEHNTQHFAVPDQESHTETSDLANLTDHNTPNELVPGEESHTETTDVGGALRRISRSTNLTELARPANSQHRQTLNNHVAAADEFSHFTDSNAPDDSPALNGYESTSDTTNSSSSSASLALNGNDSTSNITDSVAPDVSPTQTGDESTSTNTNSAATTDFDTVNGNGSTSQNIPALLAQQNWSFAILRIREATQNPSPALEDSSEIEHPTSPASVNGTASSPASVDDTFLTTDTGNEHPASPASVNGTASSPSSVDDTFLTAPEVIDTASSPASIDDTFLTADTGDEHTTSPASVDETASTAASGNEHTTSPDSVDDTFLTAPSDNEHTTTAAPVEEHTTAAASVNEHTTTAASEIENTVTAAPVNETSTTGPSLDPAQTQQNNTNSSSIVGAPSTQTSGHGRIPLLDDSDDESAAPESPTPGPRRNTFRSLFGLNPADRLRSVRNLQADARVRRASETLNNNLRRTVRNTEDTHEQEHTTNGTRSLSPLDQLSTNNITPDRPAQPNFTPDITHASPVRPFTHGSLLDTIPESDDSDTSSTGSPGPSIRENDVFNTPPQTPRLRRVARSPSLRSLANSPNPILRSPSPEPEEEEEGEEEEEEEEEVEVADWAVLVVFGAAPAEAEQANNDDEAGGAAADEWRAPDDHLDEEEEEEEEDDEGVEGLNFDDIGADVPGVARARAAFGHLEDVRVEIDDLDGDLPVGQFAPGNPAAVRARTGLLLVQEEVTGALREAWEALNFEREVAGAARQGLRHYQEEAGRLAVSLMEARDEADVAREAAFANAALLERARLELALLRRRAESGL